MRRRGGRSFAVRIGGIADTIHDMQVEKPSVVRSVEIG